VLACTHYPLLLDRLETLAPWPVNFIDPAPAIGRRVLDLTGPPGAGAGPTTRFMFTSGKAPSPALQTALDRFGSPRHATSGLPTGAKTESLSS
jgi:glutamate racemase